MEKIKKQNEMIISLLARFVFNNGEDIKKIVIKNKRNPSAWIKGYNSCDGTKGVTEIGNIARVKQPSATGILKSWENIGILYNIGTKKKPLYMNLLKL